MNELSIVRKTYDLILWYIPLIGKMPRDHKFALGDRIAGGLYDLLEHLLTAGLAGDKAENLARADARLTVLRYQTRLLRDLHLFSDQRYGCASEQITAIGRELGGWLRHARGTTAPPPAESPQP